MKTGNRLLRRVQQIYASMLAVQAVVMAIAVFIRLYYPRYWLPEETSMLLWQFSVAMNLIVLAIVQLVGRGPLRKPNPNPFNRLRLYIIRTTIQLALVNGVCLYNIVAFMAAGALPHLILFVGSSAIFLIYKPTYRKTIRRLRLTAAETEHLFGA